jgi:diketogulonate reductase-like aldo/keto reductase
VLQLQGLGTYKLLDAQLLTELLRKGLQLGTCRHIDTARMYNNEIPLGTAIKTVIAEGRTRREDLFIATKLFNLRGESAQGEIKEALQLMQLKYFDMVYLHWPFVDVNDTGEYNHKSLEEFWAELELCVTKGYVRHLAVSNFNGQLLTELLAVCKIKPVALQIEVHPYFPNTALVELAQKNGLIVIAHTPLVRGDNLDRD